MAAAASFVRNGKKVSQLYSSVFRLYIKQTKIVAIGRNYADHVKELKNTLPTEPFFFLKPTTSYLPSGGVIEIPQGITAHHEGAFPRGFGFWSRCSP
jgi:acylpyruvate hydrolase